MSELGTISENEKRIIEQIRSLKPYEFVQITADAEGRPDSFLIHRTSKVLLISRKLPEHVRVRLHDSM